MSIYNMQSLTYFVQHNIHSKILHQGLQFTIFMKFDSALITPPPSWSLTKTTIFYKSVHYY
jgi:hypothetical protein